jgi:hypothetical protein
LAERTAEFILGLIGGILGIVVAPGLFFLGGLVGAFGLRSGVTLVGWAVGGVILSIIGLVGVAFVRSHPRAAGTMMVISGLLGMFVALGLWVGALLLVVAGIIALVRKEKKPPPPPMPASTYYCTNCGKPMSWVSQYQRWYCENCKTYAPSS